MKVCLVVDMSKKATSQEKDQARMMVSSEQVIDALRSYLAWIDNHIDAHEEEPEKQQVLEDSRAMFVESFEDYDVGWVLRLL